jgi:hypothetical protein
MQLLKVMAQEDSNFYDKDPQRMRQVVGQRGFQIVREDVIMLWHSSLMQLTI